jgi:hypothetical protein
MMHRLLAAATATLFSGSVALAQSVGAGWVDPLSICQGYQYTYNLVSNTCSTNDPSGACNAAATALVSDATSAHDASNATAISNFNKEAQKHLRANDGSLGGASSWGGGSSQSGPGDQYTYAADNNCVEFDLPAGTFRNNGASYILTQYLSHWALKGAGSASTTWEETSNSGNVYNAQEFMTGADYFRTPVATNNFGYFINNVSAGATSVTLTQNPGNAANFYVGRWVFIWSHEQQYTGSGCNSASYGPNARYFDWAKVTAVNATTGVITIDTPTRFAHVGLTAAQLAANGPTRSYYGTLTDGTAGICGPARITPIDTPLYPTAIWGEVDGVHFGTNPNWTLSSSPLTTDGAQISGLIDGRLHDVLADNAFTTAQIRLLMTDSSAWLFDEADKDIGGLYYIGNFIGNTTTSGVGTYHHSGELTWIVNGGRITNFSSANGGQISLGSLQTTMTNVILNGASVSSYQFNGQPSFNFDFSGNATFTGSGLTFYGNNGGSNAPIFTAPFPTFNANVDGGYITVDNGVSVSSGTYTSATGAVNLVVAAGIGAMGTGYAFDVSGLSGTGSVGSLNGSWNATSGSTTTSINYTAATGLGSITVNGGTVTVVSIATGPNGASTRLSIAKHDNAAVCSGTCNGLGAFSSPAQNANDNWTEGAQMWKNGSFVSGCTLYQNTGDLNHDYIDSSGCTFAAADHVWVAKMATLTLTNSVGINTGFANAAWLTPGTSGIIQHAGDSAAQIPTITWTNNSGN